MDLIDLEDADLLSRVLAAPPPQPPQGVPVGAPRAGWTAPGILGASRVLTSAGLVPARLVQVGDRLKTRDGRFLRVERITEIRLDAEFLARHPEAAPCLFRRNALGAGVPHHDVALSPAQLVSVGPNRFEDRLVAAAELSRERGGPDRTQDGLVYVRFHLGEEAQIGCDGLWLAVGD